MKNTLFPSWSLGHFIFFMICLLGLTFYQDPTQEHLAWLGMFVAWSGILGWFMNVWKLTNHLWKRWDYGVPLKFFVFGRVAGVFFPILGAIAGYLTFDEEKPKTEDIQL